MATGSKFSLEAILSLTDNLTKPYKNTSTKITAINKGLTGSFRRLNNGINKTIGFIGRGIKRGAQIGLGALAIGITAAAFSFVQLDDSITNAGAKFKDIDSTAVTFKDSLLELSNAARQIGAVTEFSAVDAAGALDKFAMAGVSSSQAMALLAETTNLATSAGTDLTTAVDIVTDSLGAFGQMTTDTVLLGERMTKMSDQMAKTTTTANTSLVELFEAVGKGARTFTDAGQSMATFNSFAGIMANATIKGGEAGTALKNTMLRLANPSREAAKVLANLGVVTADANGDFRDIIDIIADFETGLEGMGTKQRTAALGTIFGTKTVNGFNVLLGEGSEALRAYREDIIASTGASRTMAEAIRGSLGNRIKVLRSGLTELGLKFIDAFDEQGRKALSRLIDFVQVFNMEPVIKAVIKAGKFLKKIFSSVQVIFKKLEPVLFETLKALKKIVDFLIPMVIPAFQILADVVAFILPIINSLVDVIIDMVSALKDAGVIDAISRSFVRLKEIMIPVIDVFFDMIKTVREFAVESGALETLIPVYDLLVGFIGLIGGAFELMWKIVKPIIKLMQILLEPILFIVRELVEGVGIVGDIFSREKQATPDRREGQRGTRGAEGSDDVVSRSVRGRASRGQETPSPEALQAIEREKAQQDLEIKQRFDINLNAPQGYSIALEGQPPATSVQLGAQ